MIIFWKFGSAQLIALNVKVSLKGLSAEDWDRRVPLPNKNGVPANQCFFTHWNREEVRDILSESLGQSFLFVKTMQCSLTTTSGIC
jgi:hypothetical protein